MSGCAIAESREAGRAGFGYIERHVAAERLGHQVARAYVQTERVSGKREKAGVDSRDCLVARHNPGHDLSTKRGIQPPDTILPECRLKANAGDLRIGLDNRDNKRPARRIRRRNLLDHVDATRDPVDSPLDGSGGCCRRRNGGRRRKRRLLLRLRRSSARRDKADRGSRQHEEPPLAISIAANVEQ